MRGGWNTGRDEGRLVEKEEWRRKMKRMMKKEEKWKKMMKKEEKWKKWIGKRSYEKEKKE